MPNHVHGIIEINKNDGRDAINRVGTGGGITKNMNPMLHSNLSRILRWYKGRTTFEVHKINSKFSWQTRFHDHIIRDFDSYYRIEQYIQNNSIKWEKDGFCSK